MFIAALVLVLSLAAFGQFAWFYWRALLVSTAADPVSDSFGEATGIGDQEIQASHFKSLAGLRDICPDLESSREHWGAVKTYYGLLSMLSAIGPAKQWALAEQAVCSRYAAVLIDRRLRANAQYLLSLNQS